MAKLKKRRNHKRKQSMLVLFLVFLMVLFAVVFGISIWKYGQMSNVNEPDSQKTEMTEIDTETFVETDTEEIVEATETEPEITDFTMFFTGDVMLGGCKNAYAQKGIDGILSSSLRQEMVASDLTMINNEFPFSTRGEKMPDKQYTFRVDPSYVSALLDMGVDVASLANNHALDFGVDALLDTFTTLDNAGISYVGAGETKERAEQAAFVEAGGRTVGVLSASRVIPVYEWNIDARQPGLFCTYDSTRLVERIKEIETQCDFVVVFVHWGLEKKAYPEEYQRKLAQQYIDAGADLVVGNHSHVPQGIEYYKGVPIVYCLGNYIFNANMTDTYALKVLWDAEGKVSLKVIPVDTQNYYTAELNQEDTQAFYDYLESISFDVTIDDEGNVSRVEEP